MTPRNGFSRTELAIVIGVLALLLAVIIPAVQQAHEIARRVQCNNNLKWIGLAMHNYHDVFIQFPPAFTGSPTIEGTYRGVQFPDANLNGSQGFAWGVPMLPYFDASPLYFQLTSSNASGFGGGGKGGTGHQFPWTIDADAPAWSADRVAILKTIPSWTSCPSVAAQRHFEVLRYSAGTNENPWKPVSYPESLVSPTTSYVPMAGTHAYWRRPTAASFDFAIEDPIPGANIPTVDGLFYRNANITIKDVGDGTSNTIAMVEHNPTVRDRSWYAVVPGCAICKKDYYGKLTDDCESGGSLVSVHALGYSQDHNFAIPASEGAERRWPQLNHSEFILVLLADGCTRTVSYKLDHALWLALCTRDGGEKLDGRDW